MPRKPKHKWDDPKESQRFIEAAKAAEASNDPKDLERAVRAIGRIKRSPKVLSK